MEVEDHFIEKGLSISKVRARGLLRVFLGLGSCGWETSE